jgi:hypothetical protein
LLHLKDPEKKLPNNVQSFCTEEEVEVIGALVSSHPDAFGPVDDDPIKPFFNFLKTHCIDEGLWNEVSEAEPKEINAAKKYIQQNRYLFHLWYRLVSQADPEKPCESVDLLRENTPDDFEGMDHRLLDEETLESLRKMYQLTQQGEAKCSSYPSFDQMILGIISTIEQQADGRISVGPIVRWMCRAIHDSHYDVSSSPYAKAIEFLGTLGKYREMSSGEDNEDLNAKPFLKRFWPGFYAASFSKLHHDKIFYDQGQKKPVWLQCGWTKEQKKKVYEAWLRGAYYTKPEKKPALSLRQKIKHRYPYTALMGLFFVISLGCCFIPHYYLAVKLLSGLSFLLLMGAVEYDRRHKETYNESYIINEVKKQKTLYSQSHTMEKDDFFKPFTESVRKKFASRIFDPLPSNGDCISIHGAGQLLEKNLRLYLPLLNQLSNQECHRFYLYQLHCLLLHSTRSLSLREDQRMLHTICFIYALVHKQYKSFVPSVESISSWPQLDPVIKDKIAKEQAKLKRIKSEEPKAMPNDDTSTLKPYPRCLSIYLPLPLYYLLHDTCYGAAQTLAASLMKDPFLFIQKSGAYLSNTPLIERLREYFSNHANQLKMILFQHSQMGVFRVNHTDGFKLVEQENQFLRGEKKDAMSLFHDFKTHFQNISHAFCVVHSGGIVENINSQHAVLWVKQMNNFMVFDCSGSAAYVSVFNIERDIEKIAGFFQEETERTGSMRFRCALGPTYYIGEGDEEVSNTSVFPNCTQQPPKVPFLPLLAQPDQRDVPASASLLESAVLAENLQQPTAWHPFAHLVDAAFGDEQKRPDLGGGSPR